MLRMLAIPYKQRWCATCSVTHHQFLCQSHLPGTGVPPAWDWSPTCLGLAYFLLGTGVLPARYWSTSRSVLAYFPLSTGVLPARYWRTSCSVLEYFPLGTGFTTIGIAGYCRLVDWLRTALYIIHCECTVFGCFHYLAFARTFVVDAAEVEYAVDDDSVEFFVVCRVLQFGVGAHGVERDE